VEGLLAHKVGKSSAKKYHTRQLTIVQTTAQEAKTFTETNHIQGFTNGSLYQGLKTREGTLIALAIWKKQGTKFYLERYCTAGIVPGGFSRLLKVGTEEANKVGATTLITFSDNELSEGALYAQRG